MKSPHLPLPVNPAPDPIDRELEPLLSEPIADAWADAWADASPSAQATAADLRARLLKRLSASRAASSVMATARRSRLACVALEPGVQARTLYAAGSGRAPRPGEPALARLIELAAGSSWVGPAPDRHREWLVMQGSVQMGHERLLLRDYHVAPAGSAAQRLHTDQGALLFLRESAAPAGSGSASFTVRDEDAGWPDFVPGIQRRVLWQHQGQAAMLYYAQPGTSVPLHTHGHDEECLMVQGELLLDDVLLQAGDYQLAPAGTAHRTTETDTGAVLYAHGDLDLKFVA